MAAGPGGEGFIRRAISLGQVRLQSALQRQLPLTDTPSFLKNHLFPIGFWLLQNNLGSFLCCQRMLLPVGGKKIQRGSTTGQKSMPCHGVHTSLCCSRPQMLIQETRLQIHLWLCGTSPGPDSFWLFAEWCSLILLHGYGELIILSDYFLTAGW